MKMLEKGAKVLVGAMIAAAAPSAFAESATTEGCGRVHGNRYGYWHEDRTKDK